MSSSGEASIEDVIELLTRLAVGDYEARGTPSGLDEALDAVIIGVNMLAEELSADRAQLEDRVQERTAELEAARLELTRQMGILEQQGSALESAVRAKGDFIGLVSHELRTPLTSLIGYLELLDGVEEPIPEEAMHYLAVASRNADRLLLLVTDLLTASELENTSMRLLLAPTDLSALANQSIDDLGQRASNAGLELIRDLPPGIVITADASRLMQVMDNLLSNAIKFTPAGGEISVALQRQDQGVDLIVRDTGIGIDPAALPHLTTKFFRIRQPATAAVPGLGLGLMITRTVVEAHHGTLSFSSREHEGTSVHVHLPVDPPPLSTASAQPRSTDEHPQPPGGSEGDHLVRSVPADAPINRW